MNPDFLAKLLAALGSGPAHPLPPSGPGPSAILAALGMTPAPASPPPTIQPRPAQYPGWSHQGTFSAPTAQDASGVANERANVAKLAASPFADSLRVIVPGGSIRYGGDNGPLMGELRGNTGRTGQTPADTVFLYHLGMRDTGGVPSSVPGGNPHTSTLPELVLAHEFGHRYASRGLVDSPDGEISNAPFERFKAAVASSPLQMPPEQYGSPKNGGAYEHFPEAFANAIDFLRTTAPHHPDPTLPHAVSGTLAQYEREVPGTKAMLDMLLKEPLYARHPLNVSRSLGQMVVQPDATAVKRP